MKSKPKQKKTEYQEAIQQTKLNAAEAGLDMAAGHLDMLNATVALYSGDCAGCLQCIEFALQNLESAKAKLMR